MAVKTSSSKIASSRAGPSQRQNRNLRSASSATIDRILDGAEAVLMKFGYAGFTTRKVAEAARVKPGNLAYHFPSKRELLRALIARLVQRYSRQFKQMVAQSDSRSHEIPALFQWVLNDAMSEPTVRIFRELWAMSLHDAVIRREVDDLYDELMEECAQILKRSRPSASITAIRELVQLMTVISEGSTVLFGTRPNRRVSRTRFFEILMALIGHIAADLDRSDSKLFHSLT